jgi:hypothetical protein
MSAGLFTGSGVSTLARSGHTIRYQNNIARIAVDAGMKLKMPAGHDLKGLATKLSLEEQDSGRRSAAAYTYCPGCAL